MDKLLKIPATTHEALAAYASAVDRPMRELADEAIGALVLSEDAKTLVRQVQELRREASGDPAAA